jgi:Arc/MetJ family transcription regulator
MRTTLNLDDALMAEAMTLSGIDEETQVLHEALRSLIERRGMAGEGLGWVDAHLLAAASLSDTALWTRDRALRRAAEALGIFKEPEA